jgi:hypothetical protein
MSGVATKPGPRGFVLAGLVALVAAVAVTAGLFARSRANAEQRPPTRTDVATLLDRHADAVLARDRKTFTADLDTGAGSEQFRSAQQRAFDNLAQVPLASWSYTVAATVNGLAENRAARTRYHAPVLIVRVDFAYALREVDPAPATYQLYLTFVRRHGQVALAGDADLAGEGGSSWHGPWEFGPLEAVRGSSSLILIDPAYRAVAGRLVDAVDAAVPAVSSVWGTAWNSQVVVVVPGTQAEMSQVLANTLPLGQIAAVTYVDSIHRDLALGARIAVNPASLSRLDATGLQITITHEVTLVATWSTRTAATPTWLSEGFAEYVANLNTHQAVRVAASELARDVAAGTVPTALPSAADFSADSPRLAQAYEQSWLACLLIAERGGPAALPAFFRQVSRSTASPAGAVDAAVESVLHVDVSTFTAQWQQFLRTELG